MKIFIKPIQFSFKNEFTIEIDENKTVDDLLCKIMEIYNEVLGGSFIFRGKKLQYNKTLKEQGIKDGTKLMLNKAENNAPKPEIESIDSIKNKAFLKLKEQGFEPSLIESVIKTLPELEKLDLNEIIRRSQVILQSFVKESN